MMRMLEREIGEVIFSEFNEKVILIRHDVDNLFDIYGKGFSKRVKKAINYAFIGISSVSIAAVSLLPIRLDHLWEVLDLERTYNAQATYFFRTITMPSPKLCKVLLEEGHEIAYHSDRNRIFEEFYKDLKMIENKLGVTIHGFTKHGYAPLGSGGPWIKEKFIGYGLKAGLKYFAQGVGNPEWGLPRLINKKLWYFGHHITLKKCKSEEVERYIKNRVLPLILVHPEDLFIEGEREKFERIFSLGRAITIIELVTLLEKIIGEDEEIGKELCVNLSLRLR